NGARSVGELRHHSQPQRPHQREEQAGARSHVHHLTAGDGAGVSLAPPQILVVDDEESVLMTLAAVLRREGYEVHTAGTGSQALQAIRKNRFDLLLSDLPFRRCGTAPSTTCSSPATSTR